MNDPSPGVLVPAPAGPASLAPAKFAVPRLIAEAGKGADFAWWEYFVGSLRNANTRDAYVRAVRRFLTWAEGHALAIEQITPAHVGLYMDGLPVGVATKKMHLSAIRGLMDKLVLRHVLVLNPAACVRGERYSVQEGKTPMIPVDQARKLIAAVDVSGVIGLRDRAVLGTLSFTAARCSAVAGLRVKDFHHDGVQWFFRMREKASKSRELPARHDLAEWVLEYMREAGITQGQAETPLFRTAVRRSERLTAKSVSRVDVWRMLKRRLKAAGMPELFSPHSFRVKTITDLLEQGVPMEDVQNLAGHADPRTTRVYDRRHRKVSRGIVERISG